MKIPTLAEIKDLSLFVAEGISMVAYCAALAFLEIFFGCVVRFAVWWYEMRNGK